jgi:hypothetical protein
MILKRRNRKLYWAGTVGLFLLFCLLPRDPCLAEAVILELRNGDRLTGTIVSESGDKVTLDALSIGKVEIPASEIKTRKKISAKRLAKAVGQTIPLVTHKPAETVVAKQPQQQEVKKRAESAKPIPAVTPPSTPKVAQPKRKLWKFDLQLGANLQNNQKSTEVYTGDFKVEYGDPKTRFRDTMEYHGSYGKIDGVLSANNMNGLVRTEFDIAKKVFIFDAGGAGYDEVRKIDFTYEDSFGVGYTMVKMTNLVLRVDTGANYQEQFFSNDGAKEYFSPRLGGKSSWKISSKWDVTQLFEFYPRSGDLEDYRLRSEATLRFLLNSYLSLNLRVADVYDTRPALGVSPNDLQINSTIGVHF